MMAQRWPRSKAATMAESATAPVAFSLGVVRGSGVLFVVWDGDDGSHMTSRESCSVSQSNGLATLPAVRSFTSQSSLEAHPKCDHAYLERMHHDERHTKVYRTNATTRRTTLSDQHTINHENIGRNSSRSGSAVLGALVFGEYSSCQSFQMPFGRSTKSPFSLPPSEAFHTQRIERKPALVMAMMIHIDRRCVASMSIAA
jgi:hypothetical protein